MPSPLEVLGLEPGASDGEIERAYRQRLKAAHPDHGGSLEAFRAVRVAYEALQSDQFTPTTELSTSQRTPDVAEAPSRPVTTVEYLNYDVVEDHGWSLDDADLFEKAAEAELDTEDLGEFLVDPGESLLEAAESHGFAWPYACRGGACANCAVAVCDGDLEMPVNHILPPEQLDQQIRLSCIGAPSTETLRVVYNVKHLPGLDELRLPADRFELAQSSD